MKKFILTFAFAALSFASITMLSSFDDKYAEVLDAPEGSAGGTTNGCYTTGTYQCPSFGGVYNAGTGKFCDFSGVYGAPIECTQKACGWQEETRRCVKG